MGLVCPYLNCILDEECILSDSGSEILNNTMVPISETRVSLFYCSFRLITGIESNIVTAGSETFFDRS